MAEVIAVGGLLAAGASAVGTAVQASRVACYPQKEKDDLCGNVKEIIVDLNEAVRKLGAIRRDLKKKVQVNNIEGPSETYSEWVRSVEEIERKVEEKIAEYHRKVFPGLSSSKKPFRQMYKKVKRLEEESYQLQDKMFVDLQPKPVLHKKGLDNDFVAHEKQFKEILDLLGNSKVKKIGILGMVGIGKTTMMLNLNNHETIAKNFDIVVWLTVSREGGRENLTREDLQQDIVSRLKLNIGVSINADEAAEGIKMRLQGKKYLLLLDDVKQYFNLKDIGIFESNNGSKVVLTTRSRHVCQEFKLDRLIKVTCLSLDKGWCMFQDVIESPRLLKNPKILKLARQVCKECGGLPLVIEKVANAFKLKNDENLWIEGLNSWKTWPEKESQGILEIYKLLKFCYDDLDDEQYKKCFLYAALYPAHSVINANYLLECWAAENLLGKDDSITKKSLIYGHLVLSRLMNVSLLEEGESEKHVTMNKVIRQVALHIAEGDNECKHMVETSKGLTEPPKVESWTEKNRISIGDNRLTHLPDSPTCNMLSTLFLHRNSSLNKIPQSFFACMTELRVLDVSHTGIEELPSSLSILTKLKVLYLNNCKNLVDLPSHIVELMHLEALDTVGSGVNNIPSHIEKLTGLRRLRVSFSNSGNENAIEEVNFNKIISKLSNLEELIIDVKSHENWSNDVVENIIKEVAMLKEFKSLKFCFIDKVVDVIEVFGSQNLRICVSDATILLSYIESSSWRNVQNIENFEFYVGSKRLEHPLLPDFHKHDKYVKYCDAEGRNSLILKVLAEAVAFELVDNNNMKQLSELELASMNNIQSCLIGRCDAIETIVGISGSVVLPSLEHLFIKDLLMLESILKGPLQSGSLAKLTTLELTGCQSLVKVFSPGTVQQFSEIERLKIEKCDEIEVIIPESDAHGNLPVLPKLREMVLQDMKKLRCICPIETLKLPSSMELQVSNCPVFKRPPSA